MKNIIIVAGGLGQIGADIIDDLTRLHQDSLICHRGNIHEFDNELQSKLLRAIEDAEISEIVNNECSKGFIIEKLPTYDMPTFLTEKKGKHTPKSKSKYLWRK